MQPAKMAFPTYIGMVSIFIIFIKKIHLKTGMNCCKRLVKVTLRGQWWPLNENHERTFILWTASLTETTANPQESIGKALIIIVSLLVQGRLVIPGPSLTVTGSYGTVWLRRLTRDREVTLEITYVMHWFGPDWQCCSIVQLNVNRAWYSIAFLLFQFYSRDI